jgi:hypothetical protein
MICSIKYFALLLPLVLLEAKGCISTRQKSLGAGEYISWVENPENGLFVTKPVGDYVFTLQYKPLPYVVMQDEKRPLKKKEMQDKTVSFSDMQYYTFRIGTVSGKDVQRFNIDNDQQFYSRLEYFSLNMQNDLKLIDNGDTLPCLLYSFERTYGIDPRASFVIAFNKSKTPGAAKTLMYSDQALGTGPILLSISASDLQQIPELSLPE